MYRIIFLCVIMMGSITSQSQSKVRTLEWWRDHKLLDSFPSELDTLRHFITQNDSVIDLIKARFDSCRVASEKDKRIDEHRTIKSKVKSIKKFHCPNTDSSFLFYYTNKELKNYLSTFDAFEAEAKDVISDIDSTMNVFNNSNFLNAYFNVCISRSLLLAATDNLERYFLLGSVADYITKTSVTTEGFAAETNSLLTNEFKPYKALNSKNSQLVNENSKDKISTAANTIFIDNRKNWWWRTLTGGVVGGLVAGLLVVNLK